MNPWLRWWCPSPYWTPETLYQPPKKSVERGCPRDRDKALQRFVKNPAEQAGGMLDV